MLNIDSVEKGLVIDHIKAGKAMEIYHYLNLDKMDCSVAIIFHNQVLYCRCCSSTSVSRYYYKSIYSPSR
jgi:aspartate carbamoyltransferase regulatory subunit